ncbi:MC122L [Molluscum contagiosum virus subtype 1]|mgnify:CR=1 FL=1|uniref:MC122L n=3 Tax=Molluscum contagiosum virus TaxID=10279 RepID=Q98289_MCV1|nr:MC122L [Molluscum contagiosum virus subtype 1]AZT86299.1 MC122L [Molluscum contagiosum virus]AAC55250.1 MC122L [Molluscum contagiosum virus subtype 1]AQY16871.1 MC122 [Molluscum contagiosum virus subtype 1]AQY17050.1 MC122 [Molluscum contagiosum virus subtype 1]AQY17229.1 MC122 [Molluscum contagiosum virus subtype 1]
MSYLNYYNIFDDFQAGAGVMDEELFTPEEEKSFLPHAGVAPGNAFFSSILRNADVRTLLGLVLFVIALGAPPSVGVFMVCAAALLMPLPCLVIAYCLAMQITHPNAGANVGMAVLCVLASVAVMLLVRSVAASAALSLTAAGVLLALFCAYALRLSRPSAVTGCKRAGAGFLPTFSDGY